MADGRRKHPGTAVGLVLTKDKSHVVLVRQYRETFGETILEVPGGLVEPGETPESAFRREVLEETGCVIGEISPLGQFLSSVGQLDEVVHLFCGVISDRPHHNQASVETVLVPIDELRDALAAEAFRDGKTRLAAELYLLDKRTRA